MWYTLLICQVEACVVTDSMWHENTTCKTETKNWSTTTTFPIAYTVIVPLNNMDYMISGGCVEKKLHMTGSEQQQGQKKE